MARELDDAILHLRINELETAMLVFKSHGERANVLACDAFLEANKAHWLVNEIRQYWKRVLKRIDVTSRTLVTLVEPGSCFVGTLAELVFAADRSYMLIGSKQGDNRSPPTIALSAMNFGPYPMSHGLTRLQSRFQADPSDVETAKSLQGAPRPDARSDGASDAAQARFQAAVANTKLPSPTSTLPTVAFGDPSAVVVPSLAGRTVRGVTEECSRLGLMPSLIGSGVALEQFPAAGAQVLRGSLVTVRFGRPGEIVPVSVPGDGN